MTRWQLLITRETVLLERYLRVLGYRAMFGARSKVKVRNLLTVNRDGMTALYVYLPELKQRLKLIRSEYRNSQVTKLTSFWEEILRKLYDVTQSFLKNPSPVSFGSFQLVYGLGRAIVFYTEGLVKILGKRKSAMLKQVGDWHERAETETCHAWDSLRPAFVRVGKQNSVDIEDLFYYIPSEFLNLLQRGKKVSPDILAARRKYYVLHMDNGKIYLYFGRKAQDIEKRELPIKKVTTRQVLTGQVASQGYAKGRVRIVNTAAQMRAMKKGEILISIMTTPRLVGAVKKAAAIVTEEGGVLSHASVISREMKIPCVIGTKIATKVFKDGDRVEVDAEAGIVRKL